MKEAFALWPDSQQYCFQRPALLRHDREKRSLWLVQGGVRTPLVA